MGAPLAMLIAAFAIVAPDPKEITATATAITLIK
jgi:hypothetical protein